jgi:hypothetical protein
MSIVVMSASSALREESEALAMILPSKRCGMPVIPAFIVFTGGFVPIAGADMVRLAAGRFQSGPWQECSLPLWWR